MPGSTSTNADYGREVPKFLLVVGESNAESSKEAEHENSEIMGKRNNML